MFKPLSPRPTPRHTSAFLSHCAQRRKLLDQGVIDDDDFAGPLLFNLALGTLLLFKGKV